MRRVALAFSLALVGALLVPSSAGADGGSGYVEPRLGGIYGRGAKGPGSYAVLIDVHSIKPSRARQPRAANCTNAGAEAGTFETTGWVIGGPRTAHLNTATVPSYLGGATNQLQNSWNAWQVDSGVPAVTLATDGAVTRYTANGKYDILWGRTGGSLATTYTWRWSDGSIESDVVFATKFTWFKAGLEGDGCYEDAGNRYDVANIATHEFGHAYGLDHPSGATFETMYAFASTGETLKRSPATGDVAGMRSLY